MQYRDAGRATGAGGPEAPGVASAAKPQNPCRRLSGDIGRRRRRRVEGGAPRERLNRTELPPQQGQDRGGDEKVPTERLLRAGGGRHVRRTLRQSRSLPPAEPGMPPWRAVAGSDHRQSRRGDLRDEGASGRTQQRWHRSVGQTRHVRVYATRPSRHPPARRALLRDAGAPEQSTTGVGRMGWPP